MKILMVVMAAVAAAAALPSARDLLLEEWKAYKLKYEKSYSTEEDEFRMSVFAKSRERVACHNQRYERGEETYKRGLNQYSDMPTQEVNDKHHGFISGRPKGRVVSAALTLNRRRFPVTVNWVEKGAVTPVKNQMNCNSCWAFSATGALEGQYFRRTNQTVSLSEQNLIDCTYNTYNTKGCESGNTDQAFAYVFDNKGIDTEQYYPYEAKRDNCRYDKLADPGVHEWDLYQLTEGSEEELKVAVAIGGPVAVAVDAEHDSFHDYAGGIYFEKECRTHILNHSMLAVGYGEDYWLLKNSVGSQWGEGGYMRMARNRRGHLNHCGVATAASMPLVW